jgi:DNA replication protein DnaC
MSDTPQLLLSHHLKALKLPTFLREYDKLARQCASEGVDHSRYLLRLSELELIDRERRMVERRIKAAQFPAVKSIDSFLTASALVHELIEARDEKRLLRLQKQLAKCRLLIIDELGYVPLSPTGAELLFETFSQRYERGSTIVTSNLPFDEWTSVFGSERLTGALLDRLTHHVHILELNGESYRLRQSGNATPPPNNDKPD